MCYVNVSNHVVYYAHSFLVEDFKSDALFWYNLSVERWQTPDQKICTGGIWKVKARETSVYWTLQYTNKYTEYILK